MAQILGLDGKPIADTQTPPASRAERRRRERELNKYLSGTMTRGEALKMLSEITEEQDEKIRILFIQIKTLTSLIINKGISTLEELDELSKPIVEEIYGRPKVEKGDNNNKDSEKDKGDKQENIKNK